MNANKEVINEQYTLDDCKSARKTVFKSKHFEFL